MTRLLDRDTVARHVQALPKWQLGDEDKALIRMFATDDFASALKLVNDIGELAEKANHHPDIELSYGKVMVTLSTHSAGGLTEKDFKLAKKISDLLN